MDSNDVFSLVLGIEDPKEQEETDRIIAEYRQLAIHVVQMTQSEGWKYFEKEIAAFEEKHKLHPEFYSQDEKLAHIHTGALYAIKFIKDWVENAQLFVNKEYEQSKEQSSTNSTEEGAF